MGFALAAHPYLPLLGSHLPPVELRLFKVRRITIKLHWGSHDGGQKNAHQPIFPYNITENSRISLAHNSVFVVLNTSNLLHMFW